MTQNKNILANGENLDTKTAHAPETSATAENTPPKTPWRRRFVGGLDWKQIGTTLGIGSVYSLLFAGLLILLFQTHRAAAASLTADDTVEAQNIKDRVREAIILLIGAVLDNVIDWVWDGAKWVYHGGEVPPPDKFVLVTDVVDTDHTGTQVWWYENSKIGEQKVSDDTLSSEYSSKDEAYYYLRIFYIDWNEHRQRYQYTQHNWFYWGNGYYPNYTPNQLTESMMGRLGDSETGKKGYHITTGYTVNVDLMHEFVSRFSSVAGSHHSLYKSNVEGESDDPGYNPVAYVSLSDMRYTWTTDWVNSGGSIFGFEREEKIYTPRAEPVKHSTQMSAIKTQKKPVDISPKNTRVDRVEMKKHKSKMFYKMVKVVTKEKGESADFVNTDGTEGTTILQQDIYEYVPTRQHEVYPEE